MIFFDSHCHIDDNIFLNDFDEVINRAINNNIIGIIVVGVDKVSSLNAINLSSRYKQLYASIGFHPHNANQCNEKILNGLKNASKNTKVVAWGEIGLDFNRMHSKRSEQESCFINQLEIAIDLKMPLILHERDTKGRLIEIINEYSPRIKSAVVHCFSGNYSEMKQYLDMGFYIGITGIISMLVRGENLRNLVNYIPVEKLLVETDAPYLTPAPEKNKTRRNEPSFIKTILLKLAKTRKEDPNKLSDQIFKNTCDFFSIKL